MVDEEQINPEEELTPEEYEAYKQAYAQHMGDIGVPTESPNLFALFKEILTKDDTSKAANLDPREVFAVRVLKHTENAMEIFDYPLVEKYLKKKAEIVLATSLSKEMAFIKAAVTTRRQLETARRESWEGRKKWKKKEKV